MLRCRGIGCVCICHLCSFVLRADVSVVFEGLDPGSYEFEMSNGERVAHMCVFFVHTKSS